MTWKQRIHVSEHQKKRKNIRSYIIGEADELFFEFARQLQAAYDLVVFAHGEQLVLVEFGALFLHIFVLFQLNLEF